MSWVDGLGSLKAVMQKVKSNAPPEEISSKDQYICVSVRAVWVRACMSGHFWVWVCVGRHLTQTVSADHVGWNRPQLPFRFYVLQQSLVKAPGTRRVWFEFASRDLSWQSEECVLDYQDFPLTPLLWKSAWWRRSAILSVKINHLAKSIFM